MEQELDTLLRNLDSTPRKVVSVLRETQPRCRKNVEQVRDMKSRMEKKRKANAS